VAHGVGLAEGPGLGMPHAKADAPHAGGDGEGESVGPIEAMMLAMTVRDGLGSGIEPELDELEDPPPVLELELELPPPQPEPHFTILGVK